MPTELSKDSLTRAKDILASEFFLRKVLDKQLLINAIALAIDEAVAEERARVETAMKLTMQEMFSGIAEKFTKRRANDH